MAEDNVKAQMRKGILEYCILAILSREDSMAAALLGFGFANNMLNIPLNGQAVGVETLYGRKMCIRDSPRAFPGGGARPRSRPPGCAGPPRAASARCV